MSEPSNIRLSTSLPVHPHKVGKPGRIRREFLPSRLEPLLAVLPIGAKASLVGLPHGDHCVDAPDRELRRRSRAAFRSSQFSFAGFVFQNDAIGFTSGHSAAKEEGHVLKMLNPARD